VLMRCLKRRGLTIRQLRPPQEAYDYESQTEEVEVVG